MARRLPTARRWFPSSQPQTLQIAVALLYWNALLGLIFGITVGGWGRLSLLLIVAEIAGAYGISNERKWGYVVAVVAAIVPLILVIAVAGFLGAGILNLLFQVALVALLLHPQSRAYYKIWYR
ncbi:MAG TPA: hypothetical protein VKR27_04790 [Acidimicrobiales bacterium]|jgi:hypothetical protein|nr:hypothetical protein [Acidimicrobiales bacterium]